jgi:hypothetical protein
LPEGWSATPGSDRFTQATIRIPTDEATLDMTVSSLPWGGTPDDLLLNVNRWRGQMGLPQVTTAEALAEDARQIKAGDNTITVVDLRGRFRRGGMAPFAGGAMGGAMPGGAPPIGVAPGSLPADHPPVGGASTPAQPPAVEAGHGGAMAGAGAAAALPKFVAPDSWEASTAGGMNRAVYQVAAGGQEALVTVSNIPASSGAMFADPLQNANLWRSGVGLAPIAADGLKDISESLEIGGHPATLVSVMPEADKPEATLAAIVTHGDQIWYFKLKGARQLVADKQAEFKAFLKTVQFSESPLP